MSKERTAGSAAGEQLTFEEVLEEELSKLSDAPQPRSAHSVELRALPKVPSKPLNAYAKAHRQQLVGLAFSGGGIRSATFNLGVLQALARFGLLRSFDYLSTVSGGGYIGAWLSAWINREGCAAVVRRYGRQVVAGKLAKEGLEGLEKELRRDGAEPAAEKWLERWTKTERRQGVDDRLRRRPAGGGGPIGLAAVEEALSLYRGSPPFEEWLAGWIRREGLDELKRDFRKVSARTTGDGRPELSFGEWLSQKMMGEGPETVERKLEREIPRVEKDEEIAADREWSPITFLRRYSNYLTPRSGLFGVDTWTAIATYLRNLVLNFAVLILSLAVLLLLPRLFVSLPGLLGSLSDQLGLPVPGADTVATGLLVAGLGLIAVSLLVTTVRLERQGQNGSGTASQWREFVVARLAGRSRRRGPRGDGWTAPLVVTPLVLAAIALGRWIAIGSSESPLALPSGDPLIGPWIDWMVAGSVVYLAAWLPALLVAALVRPASGGDAVIGRWSLSVVVSALLAGAVGGVSLGWLARRFSLASAAERIEAATWVPPAVLLILVVVSAIQVGLVGRDFYEKHRQWWNRLSGWLLLFALAWAGLFALVFYGPLLFGRIAEEIRPYLKLGWLLATALGVWAGQSSKTGGRKPSSRWIEPVAAAVPYLFMLGLAIGICAGTDAVAKRVGGRFDNASEGLVLLAIAIVLTVAAGFISARLDVNLFSMHNFYRNRLIRAYLGASRVSHRKPDPFTGFDPDDDFPLSRLRGRRPLHILNTTLNLTAGEELAWQERKAASFFFTPYHFGFDPGKFASKEDERGFRQVPPRDPRFTLGTAMAISGAAVNPNMGQHSSPALAFLMTIFNTRLGWWLRNPNREDWSPTGPRSAIALLLRELRGAGSARSPYVNLSDGGFFDNLGIYELVRRRCRFILATDAEADPDYRFSGLGNAIRRCRSDFGVDIDIHLDALRPVGESGRSRWHCAIGTIYYDTDDGAPNGTLVYLKASLTGDEPEDLLNYANRNSKFPHESTADQWFGEAQFESYRTLGFHQAQELFEAAGYSQVDRKSRKRQPVNVEKVFVDLRRAWYPPSSATARSFTRHTERLVEIFDRMRRNKHLRFLDRSLYLDLDLWRATGGRSLGGRPRPAPADKPRKKLDEDEVRAGFYLCSSMIQLMENVYLDLELGRESAHPDNRGWMNLFRHWASAPEFRKTWVVSAATYGARFQNFCRRRLQLDVGGVWVQCLEIPAPVKQAESWEQLVFALEREAGKGGDGAVAGRLLEGLGELTGLEREPLLASLRRLREPSTLCLLWMSVLGQGAVAGGWREGGADSQSEPAGAEMSFPIGFALLGLEDRKDPTTGRREEARTLRFLRIRSHLRSLGLGRRAMRCLVHLETPVETDHLLRTVFAAGRRQGIKNLFRSVVAEKRRAELPGGEAD